MSSQPLLGGDEDGRRTKRQQRGIFGLMSKLNLLTGPSVAYEAICLMLDTEDQEKQKELTETWRDHKLEELNFVGTVGALLSGCLSSTSAWPDVLQNGRDKPWTVRALNFSGLLFALFSVLIAGLQSMRLHRLSAHRDGATLIRDSLSGGRNSQKPAKIQVYAWEASLAFLVASVLCMVAGISTLVWVSTEYGPHKRVEDGWWDENSKMAVTFTAVLTFALLVTLVSQAAMLGH